MSGTSFWIDPMYSLQGSAPVLSHFPTCLINPAVLLDIHDCDISGRSLEHWIDQLLPWTGGCSCSKVSLGYQLDILCHNFLVPSDVSLLWFSVRMTVLIAAIWRQVWTSSVRAFAQINISGLLVLGTFTSTPALPSLLKICVSLIGLLLLPRLVLWSTRPPTTLVGLSASPKSMLSNPALFHAGLVWRNSPIHRMSA